VQVSVRDNNVDQAYKVLKKKLQREGVFREMKLRGHYEKPSEKRAREQAESVRRVRKLARKAAQREGVVLGKRKYSASLSKQIKKPRLKNRGFSFGRKAPLLSGA
jgi:small subunit ribosomal protein S21